MFYFVDQILESDPGRHVLGVKHVTPNDVFVRPNGGGPPTLFSSIIGEALGQLGACNVISAKDFTIRPVAGVVGEIIISGEAAVGDSILLDTTIDSLTDDAVFYHAVATVGGNEVLRLENALGPLLPMEQFNDPGEARNRFFRIYRPGAPMDPVPHEGESPARFDVSFDEVLDMKKGEEATAIRRISGQEAFLADHFPRKPVLPLSLLLEAVLELGWEVLDELGPQYVPKAIRRVKMNRFVEPGSVLFAKIHVAERKAGTTLLNFRCEVEGARVCVGELEFSNAG